jgi:zinc D-Ala-D-Ala carboxypeptidase
MNLKTWRKSLNKVEQEMALKHFKLSEFDSPDSKGSGKNMTRDFLKKLDRARDIANIPFLISSGFRTPQHNVNLRKQGYKASANSSHLKGCAADIICKDSGTRQKIVNGLIMAGFTRIGIADSFIHCDTDQDKNDAIWLY